MQNITLIDTKQNFPLLVNTNDQYQGKILEENKSYRENVSSVITRILKKGDIAIDIGSNYGYHSILMSKIVGDKGQVYTYEPLMDIYKLLTYNLLINELNNIFPSNKVLYSSQTVVYLKRDEKHPTSSILLTDSLSLKQHEDNLIKADTLDLLLNNLSTVNLINLNANGNELAILMGASEIISHSKEVSIIMPWNMQRYQYLGDKVNHLIDNFYKAKFEFWLIGPKGELGLVRHDQLIQIYNDVDILITRLNV